MQLKNVDNVKPLADSVVVDVQVDTTVLSTLDFMQSGKGINMRFGIVKSMSDKARTDAGCPGVIEGDTVIFNEFAGYHVATSDDHLYKIIDAYNIMATTTDMNNPTVDTISPINDRLLIEVLFQYADENGLVLDDVSAKDPRLEDIKFGKILKLGTVQSGTFKVGDVIGYPPYAGETVRPQLSSEEPELRVVMEESVLFINN